MAKNFFQQQLKHHFFDRFQDSEHSYCSPVVAQKLDSPRWVSCNPLLASELGLDAQALASEETLQLLGGGAHSDRIQPISLVYSGHQFGVWAGQLGDGRAMTL
ncbi:MAG: protein adenylyltransferase SelO family protein, partial [Porticoccaceae bacterium]|nr:protein adenylyltransferase SelO family protein [Porticoccaceae bacterium]